LCRTISEAVQQLKSGRQELLTGRLEAYLAGPGPGPGWLDGMLGPSTFSRVVIVAPSAAPP